MTTKPPYDAQAAMAEVVDSLAVVASNITNSCLQAFMAEMNRQNVPGGLRDSRKLREEAFAIIRDNLFENSQSRVGYRGKP